MNKVQIHDDEIPYNILETFGLTKEMVEDLPLNVIEDIKNGRPSPVIPIRVKDEQGKEIKSHTRLSLMRMDDGNVDVMFYPCLEKAPLEQFSIEQQRKLREGGVVIADMKPDDKEQTKCFVQLDKETNQVLYSPTAVVERNIQLVADEVHLNNTESRMMRDGEPVMIVEEDDAITMGIDLNERAGIRIEQGDEQQWREKAKKEWDKYTFGVNGCWVADEDGRLDYVPEEQYTEEIWNELRNSGQQKVATMHR